MAMASSTHPATRPAAPGTTVEDRAHYQAQDTALTLREGLAEYFGRNPGLMDDGVLPRDLGEGLRSHDVAHVVFGCDTSLLGEVILARWSLFGVTGSIRPYLTGFRRRETRSLFTDAFAQVRLALLWPLIKFASLAILRSLRMRRRWPFDGYTPYLDQPLADIRTEFGIRVIDPGGGPPRRG